MTVALPLLAATITTDARLIAGVMVAQRLPWLLFAMPAGVYADRHDARRTMVRSDFLRGLFVAVLAATVISGHTSMALIYVVAFGLGLMDTAFTAASTTAVVATVEHDRLAAANGSLESSKAAGEFVAGPALGGLIYSISRSVPFVADAVSFFVSALLLRGLPDLAPERKDTGGSMRHELRAGLGWLRNEPLVRTLTWGVASLAFTQAAAYGVLVLLMRQTLGLTGTGFGLILAMGAIGNVAGGMVASRVWSSLGTVGVFTGGGLLLALSYSTLAVATHPLAAGFALVVEAVTVMCVNVVSYTIRQRLIPRHMLGRVSNTIRTFIYGAIPLGAITGGLIAHRYGVRTTFAVAAVIDGLVAVALVVPLRRLIGVRAQQQLPQYETVG
jgi:MFS family permease